MKNITLTRDSVAMGDDVDAPHTLVLDIGEEWKIAEILNKIRSIKYLPNIAGGKATWSLAIDKPIAIVTQDSPEAMLICFSEYPYQNTKAFVEIEKMHFNYHVQQDSKIVYDVLRNYKQPL